MNDFIRNSAANAEHGTVVQSVFFQQPANDFVDRVVTANILKEADDIAISIGGGGRVAAASEVKEGLLRSALSINFLNDRTVDGDLLVDNVDAAE